MTTPLPSSPRRDRRRRISAPLAMLLLAGVFSISLLAPMPSSHNDARAAVVAAVGQRLPGWNIRTRSSWEGGWSVVAACGPQQLGFQLVPGHGLAPGDAWLHPEDEYARVRLTTISDDYRALVWFRDPVRVRSLSCRQELARIRALHGSVD
ncbi:MAG TPA: hypothetical protein VHU77_12480 [Candidatus Limnocylindria bacterium]|nr:hypothetical protein [Candidatus Limnocylindria bacterium]